VVPQVIVAVNEDNQQSTLLTANYTAFLTGKPVQKKPITAVRMEKNCLID